MIFELAIILVCLVICSTLLSFFFSVSGTWERQTGENQSIWELEKIVLKQFGPIIRGNRKTSSGEQKFFGFALGSHIWLNRRDYGLNLLKSEGFPENIAKLLEGRVLLRLNLKLSSDKLFLNGHVTPYKIEFHEDDSKIKNIRPIQKQSRSYRRSELLAKPEPSLISNAKPIYEA